MMNEDDQEECLEGLSEAVSEAVFQRQSDWNQEYPQRKRIVETQPIYEGDFPRGNIIPHQRGAENWVGDPSLPGGGIGPWKELNPAPYRERSPEQYFSHSEPGRPPVQLDVRRVFQSSNSGSSDYPGFTSQRQVQRYNWTDTNILGRNQGQYMHHPEERMDERYKFNPRQRYSDNVHQESREGPYSYAAVGTLPPPNYRRQRPYSPERYRLENKRAITPRLKGRQSRSRVVRRSEKPLPFEKLLQDHQRNQVSSRNIASAIRNRINEISPPKPSPHPTETETEKAKIDIGGKSIPVDDIKKALKEQIKSRPKMRSPDRKKYNIQPNHSQQGAIVDALDVQKVVSDPAEKTVEIKQMEPKNLFDQQRVAADPTENKVGIKEIKTTDMVEQQNVAPNPTEKVEVEIKPFEIEDTNDVQMVAPHPTENIVIENNQPEPNEVKAIEEIIVIPHEEDQEEVKLIETSKEIALEPVVKSAKHIPSKEELVSDDVEIIEEIIEVINPVDEKVGSDQPLPHDVNIAVKETNIVVISTDHKEMDKELTNMQSESQLPKKILDVSEATNGNDTESNVVSANDVNEIEKDPRFLTQPDSPEANIEIITEEMELQLEDVMQDSDDEELLNLRLLALSSAYRHNVDIVNKDTKVAAKEDNSKEAKAKKKKPKQKKKEKEVEVKKQKSRSRSKEKTPANEKINREKSPPIASRRTLRSSVSVVSKSTTYPTRKTKEKSSKPKDLRDPKILTLGAEIMRKRQQQKKRSLREIRNLDPDEGSKQFIKLMEDKTQKIRKDVPKLSINTKKLQPKPDRDNYEQVEMEMDSENEDTKNSATDTNTQKPLDNSVKGNAELHPPGVDINLDHTPLQESIWNLLDSPIMPKTQSSEPESKNSELQPPGTDLSLNQTPTQESIWSLLDSPLAPKAQKNISESISKSIQSQVPDTSATTNTTESKLQKSAIEKSVPSPAESVDSSNEFQHAFDPPKLPFPMESMLVGEHSVCIDMASSSDINHRDKNVDTVSQAVVTGSEAGTVGGVGSQTDGQPIPVSIKRLSTESADELRERLLQEMLTKRLQTRKAESAKPIPTLEPSHINPVPPPPPALIVPSHLIPTRPPIFSIPPLTSPSLPFPQPVPAAPILLPPSINPIPQLTAQYTPLHITFSNTPSFASTSQLPAFNPIVKSAVKEETGQIPSQLDVKSAQPIARSTKKQYLYKARRKCKMAVNGRKKLQKEIRIHKRLKRDPLKLLKLEKALQQTQVNERVALRKMKLRTLQLKDACKSTLENIPSPKEEPMISDTAFPTSLHSVKQNVYASLNSSQSDQKPIIKQHLNDESSYQAPTALLHQQTVTKGIVTPTAITNLVATIKTELVNETTAKLDTNERISPEKKKQELPTPMKTKLDVPMLTIKVSPSGKTVQQKPSPGFSDTGDAANPERRKSVFNRLGRRTSSTSEPKSSGVIDLTMWTDQPKPPANDTPKLEGLDDMLKRMRAQTSKTVQPVPALAKSDDQAPQKNAEGKTQPNKVTSSTPEAIESPVTTKSLTTRAVSSSAPVVSSISQPESKTTSDKNGKPASSPTKSSNQKPKSSPPKTAAQAQKSSSVAKVGQTSASKAGKVDAGDIVDKISRVVQLLKTDKAEILKLRVHKESRTKTVEEWKAEAATLKRKLLLLETSIEKETHTLGLIHERLTKREEKMKLRMRLKQKFLKSLRQSSDAKTSSAKPPPSQPASAKSAAQTNESKAKDKISRPVVPLSVGKQGRKKRKSATLNKPSSGSKGHEPAPKVPKKTSASTATSHYSSAPNKPITKQLVIPKSAITSSNAAPVQTTTARAKALKTQALKKSSMQVQLMKNRLEEKARLLVQAKALQKERDRLGTQIDIRQRQLSPKKVVPASVPKPKTNPKNLPDRAKLDAKKKVTVDPKQKHKAPVTKTNPPQTQSTSGLPSKTGAQRTTVVTGPKADKLRPGAFKTEPVQVDADKKHTAAVSPSVETKDVAPVTPTLSKARRTSRNSADGDTTSRRRTSVSESSTFANVVTDETKDVAQSIVKSSFSPDQLAPYLIKEESGTAVTRFFTVPECLAKWNINVAEAAHHSGVTSRADLGIPPVLQGLESYESPLRVFRSYRFNSFLRTQENVSIASPTFCHRIEPRRIFCRYALNGQCLDGKCNAQHLDDVTLNSNEVFLDLLSYCPSLLKTKDDQPVKSSDSRSVHLDAAEAVVRNLCGPTSMTLDEKCILLVSHINNELLCKMPHTTHLHRRAVKPGQKTKDEPEEDKDEMDVDGQADVEWLNNQIHDIFSYESTGPRYFLTEGDEHRSELERLHKILDNNPDDVNVRIQLAKIYLVPTDNDLVSMGRSLDHALNILCLGIEKDELSEKLWCAYLPLFRHHHHGDLENKEEQEDIIDQVLLLLPYSKPIWREVMKWNWSYSKLDGLYQQLINNLIHRYEVNDEDDKPPVLAETAVYYSSWLVCSIVERCHLAQLAAGRDQALHTLTKTLNDLDSVREKLVLSVSTNDEKQSTLTPFPLTQKDNCSLRLTYIHVVEFGGLPDCFYDDSLSDLEHGLSASGQNINLPFSHVNRLNNDPDQLRELIKDSLLCCDDPSKPPAGNIINCLPLYRALVQLEASLQRWEAVSITCKRLVEMVQSKDSVDMRHATDVWYVWIDSIPGCQDAVLITKTFDRAVTACPWSAKLAYMAAMYQLHCDSPDLEAALLYMETCLSTFYDLEGKNGLSSTELHAKFKQLLKHDAPLIGENQNPTSVVNSKSFLYEKAYLWLVYCLLTELSGGNSIEVYEAAVHNVANEEGRKAVWLHYLLYLRSTASSLDGSGVPTTRSAQIELIQRRMKWIRNMTSVVRRCLQATSCKRSVESHSFTDYSFHNKVADIYLTCFSGRQKSVALSILTDAMPTNVPLLLRAAGEHLQKGDNTSVIATLWRVTSSSKSRAGCHDVRVWKIAIGAYLAERNYKKAIRLCLRSLAIMPYSYRLWRDASMQVSALLALHGSKKDIEAAGVKCQKMLDQDIRTFVDESPVANLVNLHRVVQTLLFGHNI